MAEGSRTGEARERPLLRLATAGSVDDGKSTLIGRLLFDSKQTFIDQMAAIERTSRDRGSDYVELALLTDGLRSERQQGITIDVAYRYFQTPRRKFILADTPGHVQYTRNMVTGASTADCALILVDARRGVLEQTRRHAYLSALLGIRHFILCVNKMDLVDFDEATFRPIAAELSRFLSRMAGLASGADAPRIDARAVPISAKEGDNVVQRSTRTPWYDGPPLLELLENINVADPPEVTARFPVQYVIRPRRESHRDYRGYAGTVAGGRLRVGDDVVVLPAGHRTTVAGIDTFDGAREAASAGEAVTLRLADEFNVDRGDMIASTAAPPRAANELSAHVCWMSERSPLSAGQRLRIKHATRSTRALVDEITARLDVNTLDYDLTAQRLELNDIGRVRLRLMSPLVVDAYESSRSTGAFILIDEASRATVGAGMVNSFD